MPARTVSLVPSFSVEDLTLKPSFHDSYWLQNTSHDRAPSRPFSHVTGYLYPCALILHQTANRPPHSVPLIFCWFFPVCPPDLVSILLCLSLCLRRLMSMDASIGRYPLVSDWVCKGGTEWKGRGQWIYLPISYPARLCNASGCMFRPKAIESIRQPSAIATGLPGSRGVCRSTLPSLWVLSHPLLGFLTLH